MKKVLCEQKKIKLLNKWHFVENKTETTQHVIKMWYISLMPTHLKWISRGVFSCIHMCKCKSYIKANVVDKSSVSHWAWGIAGSEKGLVMHTTLSSQKQVTQALLQHVDKLTESEQWIKTKKACKWALTIQEKCKQHYSRLRILKNVCLLGSMKLNRIS
jgi:hypothetical protein